MGKRTSLMDDDLFARAERVRSEAIALSQQLAALRELRTLERDFRAVTRELALAMSAIEMPGSPDGLRRLLMEAEETSQFDNWA
jgi:hypothetical protein